MQREKRGWVMPILAGCLLAVCAGCSSKSTDKFIPSETQAREALEAALTAWKDGKQPGLIEGTPIPVHAVDSQWQTGKKKLTAYEIVAQEPGEGPPLFSVSLTIQGSSQPTVVRYYVVGKDPLWVYREEDYNAPKGGM
jgi:hypothetical protein